MFDPQLVIAYGMSQSNVKLPYQQRKYLFPPPQAQTDDLWTIREGWCAILRGLRDVRQNWIPNRSCTVIYIKIVLYSTVQYNAIIMYLFGILQYVLYFSVWRKVYTVLDTVQYNSEYSTVQYSPVSRSFPSICLTDSVTCFSRGRPRHWVLSWHVQH